MSRRAGGDVAAIVMAGAARPGLCKKSLEPLLGASGCARLQAVLVERAVRWAEAAGTPYLVFAPDDAEAEMAALAPGATLVRQRRGDLGARLAGAFRDVHELHGGPAVLVGVDTPQIGRAHAEAALDDLRDGCDVTIGPASDGGYYLLGLRSPRDELFALPSAEWGGPNVAFLTLEAAHRGGMTLGMLRAERALEDEADVRAVLADPCSPGDVVAALRDAPTRA